MQTDYVEQRLLPQMKYYHKKCVVLRKEYYTLSIIMIFINASIPVLSMGIENISAMKYIIASLSALATAFSSVLLLRKTKETWINYRNTYERLKKEQVLFENSAEKYADKGISTFIQVCENIMETEHNSWKNITQKDYNKRSK